MSSNYLSSVNSFRLLDLPPEIISRVGMFATTNRLAFPTGALSRHLKDIFGDPINIAGRATRHYPSPERALVAESSIGNVEVIRTLLAHADVNKAVLVHNVPHFPLSQAAKRGHLEAVRCLLDAGAEVDQQNGAALTKACQYGHASTAELLAERGSELDKLGAPCLRIASHEGHFDVVKFLLDRGVVPRAALQDGLAAAFRFGHLDIVDVIASRGDLFDHLKSHWSTFMDLSVTYRRLEAIQYLLDNGVDLMSSNGYHLSLAAHHGYVDVVMYLLDAGDDIHAQNDGALISALAYGREAVVKVLLERGALADPARSFFMERDMAPVVGANVGQATSPALTLLDKCLSDMLVGRGNA